MTIDRSFRTISTVELTAVLDDPATIVVDTRPLAAYNGWRLEGEARGGHIPGAIALPATWLPLVDDETFADLLATKGILTEGAVVVYGYGAEDARSVSVRLHDLGQRSVVYDGWAEWSADASLPLEKLPTTTSWFTRSG